MEAENKKARLKAKLRFTLVFAIALIVTTTGGIVTIVTAQKGISLLESKKAEYDNVFKKQAELNFQIEELFRDLNNLKTKRRNSSEHKHMQKLITKKRLLMENDIAMQADKSKYEVYKAMLEQIRVIQSSMDDLDRESKKRESNMEQLEKCSHDKRRNAMGKHPFPPAADFLSSRNLYHTLPVYTQRTDRGQFGVDKRNQPFRTHF